MTQIPVGLAAALAGQYVLSRVLGEGGMARVYEARDVKHERLVAIKVLHPELRAAIGSDRFLQEIHIAARLIHPHILMLIDSGEADGMLYYVMPHVEGESLRDRLRREGRLPVDAAIAIGREVADALAYAHARGVIHRDIKPENILFESSHAVVSDFGIARALSAAGTERLTVTGLAVGTPAYMSPEQAMGELDVDQRSDIYSLGCVVYEMLAGEPPFTGATGAAVIAQQISATPKSLSTLRPDVPPYLSRAVEKAMAKLPTERFATAQDFAAALAMPAAGPDRRSRRLLIGAAALTAVLVLGLVASRSRWQQGTDGQDFSSAPYGRKLSQLTFGEGVEQWPAWSPDGATLAYVAEAGGFRKIFSRGSAGGAERAVTRGNRDDIQPSWSADGRRLAFVRASESSGKLEPTDINGWYQEGGDIWTVDLETGAESRLIEAAFAPAFSPDGTRLAFEASWGGARRIWVADAGGRNPRQLTSDSSEAVAHTEAAWSPDSRRIVFRRSEKNASDIVVSAVESGTMRWVTQDNVLDMNPVWSRDGRHVYFSSFRGGGLNLWGIAVDAAGEPSGLPFQLTAGAGEDITPTLDPEGKRIAFAVRALDADLWQLPMDPLSGRPTGSPEVVSATTRVESRGAWSPDGGTLAFNSDRRGDMNIWLRNRRTGAEQQLTTGPGGDFQPAWSPDGGTIVFFSARAGDTDLWAVRVSDGHLTRLTTERGMETNPFYSPDGAHIAFLSDRRGRLEVWVMNADGSRQRAISSMRAGGHFLCWTQDGQAIVFRAEGSTQMQIMQAKLDDGSLTRLPDVASGAHMSWSPDRSLIIDVKGHRELWVHPMNGQPPYRVFDFPEPHVRIDYPRWSPDGRHILFDRAAPRGGDVWLLEGLR